MRVLIACEFSGIVRDAFLARGHYAVSCDLLPTEKAGPHIRDDVLKHLDDGWDLMIAHPPCTYLSSAALFRCRPPWDGWRERVAKSSEAIEFFRKLLAAPIKRICMENPPGAISRSVRKPDQIVRMYEFGSLTAIKPTCLWLVGLAPLKATTKGASKSPTDKHGCSSWYAHTRSAHLRSRTFPGLAEAMAEQWGK